MRIILSRDISDKVFFESVERWIQSLHAAVDRVRWSGKKVILLAISRKMPRLLQGLIKADYLDADTEGMLQDILLSTEYVTEHAIPFIYSSFNEQFETIIIDDTAVFGNTIRSISEDVYVFSGRVPYVLPIFASKEAYFGSRVRREFLDSVKPIPLRDIQKYHSKVDEIIEEAALPIDVDFPILRYQPHSGSSARSLYNEICRGIAKDTSSEIKDSYSLEDEDPSTRGRRNSSFSVLLRKKMGWIAMTSFSKIRLFRLENEVILTSFSPQILSEDKVVSRDIFDNSQYNRIWNSIISSINKKFLPSGWRGPNERVVSSLVVMANYLLSISRLNDFVNSGSLDLSRLKINIDDVSLLVGSRLGLEITGQLNRLLTMEEATSPFLGKAELPDLIVPKPLAAMYKATRLRQWAIGLRGSIDDTLDGIFETMDYSKDSFVNSLPLSDRMRFGIYESQESLAELLEMRPQHENVMLELNRWIDKRIDDGKLVPCYKPVESRSGKRWWRRVFTNSKSAIAL